MATGAEERTSERLRRLWALVHSTTASHERVVAQTPSDARLVAALQRLRALPAGTYANADDLSAALRRALGGP